VQDSAGNANTAASNTITFVFDTTSPDAVLTTSISPIFTKFYPIDISIAFSEEILAIDLTKVTIAGGDGAALVTVTAGYSYTVDITPDGEGDSHFVTAQMATDSVTDLAGI